MLVQLGYPPTTREELWWAVRMLIDVTIPRTRVCPDHCAPFDAFADAYFGECSIVDGTYLDEPVPMDSFIWLGSRGLAGKSKSLATLGLTFAHLLGADITILGGSMSQSANVHEYMRAGLDAEQVADLTIDETATRLVFTNRGRVRPLPASQKNVRGPHPSVLLCVAGWTQVRTPGGPRRIDTLRVGQIIGVSFDMRTGSWDTVQRVVDQGYKRTLIIGLSNGTEITCTPDHRFATGRGWVEAQHLTPHDVLTMWQAPVEPKDEQDWSLPAVPSPSAPGGARQATELHRLRSLVARSDAQPHWTLRDLPPQDGHEAAEELFAMRHANPGPGRSALRDVPGLLDCRTGASTRSGEAAVRPVWQRADRLDRDDLPGLLSRSSRSQGQSLSGLRHATQVRGVAALSSVSPQVHGLRAGGSAIRRRTRNWPWWRSHLTLRDLCRRTARRASYRLPTFGRISPLDPRLRPRRDQDSDRSARGVLARPTEEQEAGSGQARGPGVGGLASAVLAHGSDPPVVVGLRPGPYVRCWDVTTSAGNFFAGDVLVHNCDEADEMELAIYDAALGQPLPQPNYLGKTVPIRTVTSSTWQNPDGTFTEILRRAEEKGRSPYRWCYRESANPIDGWLTEATIQQKRDAISAEMFRVEYDLGEPSIGNRAFDTDAVEAAFCLPFEPILSEERKDFEEYTFARPVPGASYVATADWAKEQDKTVLGILRIDDGRRELVWYQRVNRRPYPVMIGAFNDAIRRYKVERRGAWHDSTGLGNVVNDYLDTRAQPFPMTGDKRAKLLSDFVNAIEKSAAKGGPWKLPRIGVVYREMKHCRTGDLYSTAQDYHLPDTVCMLALAEYAAGKVIPSVAPIAVAKSERPTKLQAALSHPPDEPVRASDPLDVVEAIVLTV